MLIELGNYRKRKAHPFLIFIYKENSKSLHEKFLSGIKYVWSLSNRPFTSMYLTPMHTKAIREKKHFTSIVSLIILLENCVWWLSVRQININSSHRESSSLKVVSRGSPLPFNIYQIFVTCTMWRNFTFLWMTKLEKFDIPSTCGVILSNFSTWDMWRNLEFVHI